MANNFKPWVDLPTAGQQVQSASVFATDAQRVDGFKAGDPASALRVNSALRQANIVVAGLMQMCDDIKTLPNGLSLMSTVTQVKNAIKAAIDQLDATVLASAKSYTDTREGVINGKLTDKQNQITSNKNRLDALEPRVDDLEDEVAALSGGGGGSGGGGDSTREIFTTLSGPIDGIVAGGSSANYVIDYYTFYEDRIVGQVTISGGGGSTADYIAAMLDFMNHPINGVNSIFEVYSLSNGDDYNFDLTLTSDTDTDIDIGGYTGKYVLLKDCSRLTGDLPRIAFIGDTVLNIADFNSNITEGIECRFTLRFSPRV